MLLFFEKGSERILGEGDGDVEPDRACLQRCEEEEEEKEEDEDEGGVEKMEEDNTGLFSALEVRFSSAAGREADNWIDERELADGGSEEEADGADERTEHGADEGTGPDEGDGDRALTLPTSTPLDSSSGWLESISIRFGLSNV